VVFQDGRQVVCEGLRAERGGEEPGSGDADLPGREETVGVGGQRRDFGAPAAACRQGLDLALAQGDQSDLRRGEEGADEQEREDESSVSEG
jgi:hypothetical protein